MLKKLFFISFILINLSNSMEDDKSFQRNYLISDVPIKARLTDASNISKDPQDIILGYLKQPKYTLINKITVDQFNEQYKDNQFSAGENYNDDLSHDFILSNGDCIKLIQDKRRGFLDFYTTYGIKREGKYIAKYRMPDYMHNNKIIDNIIVWKSRDCKKLCFNEIYTGKIFDIIYFDSA